MWTLVLAAALASPQLAPNTLSPSEKAQGFESLFDGSSMNSWAGFKSDHIPKDWVVLNGEISCSPRGEGGDIRTRTMYSDFDFRMEWKMSPGGNSGIMYRSTEDHDAPWETGPEYQLLDDFRAGDGRNPLTRAASAYALYAPNAWAIRDAGQWNETRIVVKGSHVEHWLNGVKVVEYVLGSDDWKARYEKSKFRSMPDYGKKPSGYIALQDHGYPVWFRNIRIKRL